MAAGAQTALPLSAMDYTHRSGFENNDASAINHLSGKKWFVTRYSGLSTGFSFFNGGNANFVSVPLGLQLNRRLNNNLYAFAGVSAAPSYINFNRSFRSFADTKTDPNKSLFKSGAFGVYSRAELGLMYINDDRTFSISGSIGVQQSSYPLFPFQPMATTASPVILPANQ
ncbi:hypothetical protein [Agriterribacter sp.]|uniref:hypothetical protein n=1 Tax=Agriterribacter sp. TaxID=2821509 RepID=UPI002D1FB8B2|nr:hypothetical protein [Agriterribacter sp.]